MILQIIWLNRSEKFQNIVRLYRLKQNKKKVRYCNENTLYRTCWKTTKIWRHMPHPLCYKANCHLKLRPQPSPSDDISIYDMKWHAKNPRHTPVCGLRDNFTKNKKSFLIWSRGLCISNFSSLLLFVWSECRVQNNTQTNLHSFFMSTWQISTWHSSEAFVCFKKITKVFMCLKYIGRILYVLMMCLRSKLIENN